MLSETANVTGLNGSFESVCCFVFNFRRCLFTSLGVCLWNLDFILLTNESPWRTFNVLVHCVLQGSSLYTFPFWLKDFHLCVYNFCFPPSLTFFSFLIIDLVEPFDLIVSPRFHQFRIIWFMLQFLDLTSLALCVTMAILFDRYFWLRLLHLCASYFNALWPLRHSWHLRKTYGTAQMCICYVQSTLMGCWCHLVKWFDWSMVESNLVWQWDKPSSRWKESAFWDRKWDRVERELWKRLLFCI